MTYFQAVLASVMVCSLIWIVTIGIVSVLMDRQDRATKMTPAEEAGYEIHKGGRS